MDRSRLWARAPILLMGFGAVLFVAAVAHHGQEILALDRVVGPLLALLLDGFPALVLVYAGYRLFRIDFSPRDRRTILGWSLSGSVLFVGAMGATFLVRASEGRAVTEPTFPLLVAAEAGGIAGFVAGYYHARARTDARRARTVSDALAFINELIRHDLRNDLNVIRGHAELLVQSSATSESGAGDPGIVADKTDEALTRIETSRVIADTLVGDPNHEPTDLVPVIHTVGQNDMDIIGTRGAEMIHGLLSDSIRT